MTPKTSQDIYNDLRNAQPDEWIIIRDKLWLPLDEVEKVVNEWSKLYELEKNDGWVFGKAAIDDLKQKLKGGK